MFNLPGHSSLSYNLNFSKVLSFDPFIKSVLMCSLSCLFISSGCKRTILCAHLAFLYNCQAMLTVFHMAALELFLSLKWRGRKASSPGPPTLLFLAAVHSI